MHLLNVRATTGHLAVGFSKHTVAVAPVAAFIVFIIVFFFSGARSDSLVINATPAIQKNLNPYVLMHII